MKHLMLNFLKIFMGNYSRDTALFGLSIAMKQDPVIRTDEALDQEHFAELPGDARFTCSKCGKIIRTEPPLPGMLVSCKSCGSRYGVAAHLIAHSLDR